jgi:hypothetical protein
MFPRFFKGKMIDIEVNFYEVKKRSPDRNRGRLPKLTAYEKIENSNLNVLI